MSVTNWRVKSYYNRFWEHYHKAKEALNEGDLPQAAEKIWGAVSAFVNVFSLVEHREPRISDKRKKEALCEFVERNIQHDSELRTLVNDFSRGHIGTLADALEKLHKFFYGGSRLSDEDLKRFLECGMKLLSILARHIRAIMAEGL